PLGRTELAEYLCADRSAMTRELSKLKSEGIIEFDKRTFTLLKHGI
ncbi:MAG: winged helix-turn-helix domain-containing protein, partial [Ruminiclostridium sp.]|nr:winged helix-turn-helix domain-containing protein [Ruminiclostridium sp.]